MRRRAVLELVVDGEVAAIVEVRGKRWRCVCVGDGGEPGLAELEAIDAAVEWGRSCRGAVPPGWRLVDVAGPGRVVH